MALVSAAHTLLRDATIPLAGLPSSVSCPYCSNVHIIPETKRAELARYERDVSGELGLAAQERSRAASWAILSGGRGGRSRGGRSRSGPMVSNLMFGGMFAVLIGMAVVAQLLMMSGGPELVHLVNVAMPIVLPVIVLITFVGYMIWARGGGRRAPADGPAVGRGGCPRCGADNAVAVGQSLVRCVYCAANVVASPTMIGEGLHEAVAARNRAELERHRVQRSGMAAVMRRSMGSSIPYVILGYLPMTLGAAIAATVDGATNRPCVT